MVNKYAMYTMGALTVAIAGSMFYRSIERDVPKVDFNKIEWCEVDSRGRDQYTLYSDFLRQHKLAEDPSNKKRFVEELTYRNGGDITTKSKIMAPCGL